MNRSLGFVELMDRFILEEIRACYALIFEDADD